ncbi:MAG: hypothetical protein D6685_08270 [Bacteroidetes bacterium]|nr:MAG: hypothetical protein D6685_08270 [Bacteroidota bacterium]
MQTVWKVYNGFLYKMWLTNDCGWCVEVRPRRGRAVPGLNAEAASEFITKDEAEVWARDWINQAAFRMAAAI